jgi:hypothetical protein
MTLNEALSEWYEKQRNAKGNVNRNVMAVGLGVSSLLKSHSTLPPEVIASDNKSQVRGLSGSLVKKILANHGIKKPFAEEGGRTSRKTLPLAQSLAVVITPYIHTTSTDTERQNISRQIENFFITKIKHDYFDKQTIKVNIDVNRPVSQLVADIFESLKGRSDHPAGAVAQHLVGAKLQMRFPNVDIGQDNANAADQQTDRQGDFQINTTAFHVTVAPMEKLVIRCKENIRNGFRPVLIVSGNKLAFAEGLMEAHNLKEDVDVTSIETFIGTNISELGMYDVTNIKKRITELVRTYNDRIVRNETDQSLRIEEPTWMKKVEL